MELNVRIAPASGWLQRLVRSISFALASNDDVIIIVHRASIDNPPSSAFIGGKTASDERAKDGIGSLHVDAIRTNRVNVNDGFEVDVGSSSDEPLNLLEILLRQRARVWPEYLRSAAD